jgi:hypothetical protein
MPQDGVGPMLNRHETVDSKYTFKAITGSYEGFSEQYVPEVLEQFPSHQDKPPMGEKIRPQDQLCITGPEAMAKTGKQGLLFQSHKAFTSSQDARTQDTPEATVKISFHEQLQEQITFPKEANGSSQDSGYSTAPEAMVTFGQTSPPSQDLAISLFDQYARNQYAPEAVPKIEGRNSMAEPLCTILQNKTAKIGHYESTTMKDSDTIMQKEGWTKETHCDISAPQLIEYGANNILLPPLADPLQQPSTPVTVSEPMDEAPETPETGNVIQSLVKNYFPPHVTQLSIFEISRLIQYNPLSTFNPKKWVDPAPMKFQHRTVKKTFMAY